MKAVQDEGNLERMRNLNSLGTVGDPEELKAVTIYVGSSCLDNPGRGGFGGVLSFEGGAVQRRINGGRAHTTNNRMEIMAAIQSLESLEVPHRVCLISDSQYLVGQVHGCKQSKKNRDLTRRLRRSCREHEVNANWVRGRNGGNEQMRLAHYLASLATCSASLPRDLEYEDFERRRAAV